MALPDAERVIIAMGSICETRGSYRLPDTHTARRLAWLRFVCTVRSVADKLIAAIPETAKKIAVLDRTKEPGSQGEPLYMDVVAPIY